jgi:hypothetical protein
VPYPLSELDVCLRYFCKREPAYSELVDTWSGRKGTISVPHFLRLFIAIR